MADVINLFRDSAFDPETVKLLCAAYDKATKQLRDTGQPPLVSEIIAQKIIKLAQSGERNPERLCDAALGAIKIRRSG